MPNLRRDMGKKLTIAKITRPNPTGVFARERLCRLMDQAGDKPVTWVAAPAGSGKTTAIASYIDRLKTPCVWYQLDQGDQDLASFFYYMGLASKKAAPRFRTPLPLLTPEYLLGIPVFTRRFFENFFRRLTPPAFLIFDDYQDVPDHGGFHEIMAQALEVVPAGIRIVILSRSEPPPQFARLRANNRIYLLGWEEMRFTADETRGLVQLSHPDAVCSLPIETLYEKTAGWVAGVVLLLARAMAAGTTGEVMGHPSAAREVFDYFASQIFDKADSATQELLLKTAFLQRIDAASAEELTGNRQAGNILEQLCRHHYFTEQYGSAYRYHPLFREFLLSSARMRYAEQEVSHIQRAAARVLEKQGLPEEAVKHCIDAGDWQEAGRLIVTQAPGLVSQGRSKTLDGWISSFPAAVLTENPWLLYWLGICRVPFAPVQALGHFQDAFRLFEARKDLPGTLRSWSAAVNAVFAEWNDFSPYDELIDWYYAQPDGAAFPSPEIEAEFSSMMSCALVFRRSSHPDLRFWVERSLDVSRTCGNPGLRLQVCIIAYGYFMWAGDIARETALRDEARAMSRLQQIPPFFLVTLELFQTLTLYRVADSPDEGLRALSEVIQLSRTHGIYVWDNMMFGLGVYGSILKGDSKGSLEFLATVQSTLRPERRNSYGQYHALSAWHYAVFGDQASALHHAELAVKLTLEVAEDSFPVLLCRIILANVLCESEKYQQAEQQLSLAEETIVTMPSAILEFMLHLATARLELVQGRSDSGLAALRRGLELGRSRNYMTMYYWWQPTVMAQLCARALEEKIEPDYVRRLIKRNRLLPDATAFHVEGWPWFLRIRALGRFEVLKDDEPVDFSGKRKILELLKVLISFGGLMVRAERIIDQLWPDADGDDARNSFKMTLSRLRRLLPEEAILYHDGMFSLNRRLVWTDVWAYENLTDRAEALWGKVTHSSIKGKEARTCISEAMDLSDKAINLYQGEFLPGDAAQVWAAAPRERLRGKLLRLITLIGRHHEDKGRWKSAAGFYGRGLEADCLQEEFYYCLMKCHIHLGQHPQALATYERCCAELSAALDIAPSMKTQSLYATISNQK